MERRTESRLKANQSVIVTALGLLGAPPMFGHVVDMSGSGLQVRLPNPVPLGSHVKVETPHIVMMGEVNRCDEHPQEDDFAYVAGLTVFHIAPTDETP
ncbi:MAG TPA: PilZ domain-containing protein [Bryobacteraceae bacterium]|nr:PilZ domain-containing protein [Bryobacteraceae bacterium]